MERPDSPRMSSVDRVTDVVESVKAYAVQETVGPARGAARWLAYGTLAALFMGTGVVFLGLAALRLSQDAGGAVLDGAWSFVHYLVAAVVLSVTVAIALSRTSKTSLAKD